MDRGGVGRAWLGIGRRAQAVTAVWRLASVASLLALVGPIMLIGRRPYPLGTLVQRLRAVQDMALVPDGLASQLSWFRVLVIGTVVGGSVIPVRGRRMHLIVLLPTLLLAVLIRRGGDTDWTTPTGQLAAVIVLLVIACVAAALPCRGG